jgi:hypothetical protein
LLLADPIGRADPKRFAERLLIETPHMGEPLEIFQLGTVAIELKIDALRKLEIGG